MSPASFGLLLYLIATCLADDYQWTYDEEAFGGPSFWGLLNRDWVMCKSGRLQSPIDIRPEYLLFDPNIKPVHLDRINAMAEFVNTGQMPRVRIGNNHKKPAVNMTGGPFNGYRYRLQRIDIHMGKGDVNGSEHTINGKRFPMELQLLAYNSDLYTNFSSASKSPHGIAGISILVDIGSETTEELLKLTIATSSIMYRKQRQILTEIEPWKLLPYTRDYVTYEGSMTSPGCEETVLWIIINQPIHIAKEHYFEWEKLLKSPVNQPQDETLAPNFRQTHPFHARLLRTNINHKRKQTAECKMPLPKMFYKTRGITEDEEEIRKAVNHHKRRHARHHNEEFSFDVHSLDSF
ncbi:hypothetical protein WR25_02943 [Diploscapter pachys]|uniref:Alpha-carbonic anhydrase domain-containing protein n=1 Tax=Diploscapter pachys TaxID=2018661 RepID=A0A2A2KY01_9BILA|nr:hypothetical protein WR25_02943 [Diploscapter pachys]